MAIRSLKVRGNEWLIPAGLALTHAILSALAFHPAPYTGGDDATYIALAQSVLERGDYTDVWDPALPPHTQYPPIFPLILAGGLALGLSTDVGLELLVAAITTAAVFCSCLWLRRVASAGIATAAGLAIAISPEVIRLGNVVLSDTTFWFFSMMALLVWERGDAAARTEGGWPRIETKFVILAGAFTLCAYFTRSAGAPLLAATLAWLALRKDWRGVSMIVAMTLPFIAAWWLRGNALGATGYLGPFLMVDPYKPELGTIGSIDLLARLIANLGAYSTSELPRLVLGSPSAGAWLGVPIIVAAIVGRSRRLEKMRVTEIWFPIYIWMVLFWPQTWAGSRFLMPIMPVLALYVGEAVAALARRLPRPRLVSIIVVAAFVAAAAPSMVRRARTGSGCRAIAEGGEPFPCIPPEFQDFFVLAAESRGKLPPGSAVLSRKPTIFYLYSGYRSRLYPLFAEPDSLFNAASATGAEFVAVDQIEDLAPLYLHPVLLARRDDFCLIPELTFEHASLARIERGGLPRASGAAANAFRSCPLQSHRTPRS